MVDVLNQIIYLFNVVHLQVQEDIYTCNTTAEECRRETSNANNIQEIYVDLLLTSTKSTRLNRSLSQSHQNSDAVSTSFSSSIAQQSSPDSSDSPMIERVENFVQFDSRYGFTVAGDHTKERQISGRNNSATPVQQGERTTAASSPESLPQFQAEKVVYLDDIEEFQSSVRKDQDCQDWRLFKFKPSVLPKTETVDGCNENFMGHYDSRSSRKSSKASEKQPRRRSLSRENSGLKDIECEIYYEKPRKSSANKHRSHHHRNTQKNSAVEESKQPKQGYCIESGSNLLSCNCKYYQMKSGCHSHFSGKSIDDDEKREAPSCKQQTGIRKSVGSPMYHLKGGNLCYHFDHCHSFQNGESVEDMDTPNARRKSYDNGSTEYNVFTYPNRRLNEGKVKGSDSPRRCSAINSSRSEEGASQTGKKTKPPYLTVKTMPPERAKESWRDNILRCKSFPCEYPDHVHPKLPNYDDIAAKFIAIKKENLQNKHL